MYIYIHIKLIRKLYVKNKRDLKKILTISQGLTHNFVSEARAYSRIALRSLPLSLVGSVTMRFDHRPVIAVLLVFALHQPCLHFVSAVGVNWGTFSSHPLPPSKVVQSLLRTNNIGRVKLSDANSGVLESLSGTGIGVVVGIPNEMLKSLSSSKKAAQSWVHDNITRYIPATGGGVRIE